MKIEHAIHATLINSLTVKGYRVYLVGGAVRDFIIGKVPKDYDYVVTNITYHDLEKVLIEAFPDGKINPVGVSFGIIKLNIGDAEYDFAIPRSDTNRDIVSVDPSISIDTDLSRRDFTINSVAYDIQTHELISPNGYDCVSDIKHRVLRTVGNPVDRFTEDPLRIIRGVQFSSRFNMSIDSVTWDAIKQNVTLLKSVSSERYYEEFYKAITRSPDSTIFVKLLEDSGIAEYLFGDDIHLIPVANTYNDYSFIVQILYFFGWGNPTYKSIILKSEEIEIIDLFRFIISSINSGLIVNDSFIAKLSRNRRHLPIIFEAIRYKNDSFFDEFVHICKKPVIHYSSTNYAYELCVSGGELLEIYKAIGVELKGKGITDVTNKLIKAFHNDLIKNNDKDSIRNFIVKEYK